MFFLLSLTGGGRWGHVVRCEGGELNCVVRVVELVVRPGGRVRSSALMEQTYF